LSWGQSTKNIGGDNFWPPPGFRSQFHELAKIWNVVAETPSPPGAIAYFHYPLDGIHVPQRFTVRIGLKEMGVAPAGVDKPNTGHHHLLVDTDMVDLTKPIPSDYNHIHLGNGQTEVVLTLPPGPHTLQLLLADQNHIPHKPPVMSKKITIYVR
jgi:hypothetical protein